MQMFRWLRKLSLQEHAYFLLVLLSVVPNVVFLFTEPYSVAEGMAALLMPLAFWLIFFLVARKPGIAQAWILPMLLLDGGQLVLLYLFGQSVIAVDMFLNLTSSNASEASELLGNLLLVIGGVVCLYILPTLWIAWRSIRARAVIGPSFRRRWMRVGAAVFGMGFLFMFLSLGGEDRFSFKDDVYPFNAFYNLFFAIQKAEKNSRYNLTSADFRFDALKMEGDKSGKREIYVLIVGETARAMEWSLYGYERETTPNMDALDGMVYFRDVITQSNNTHKSVPIILSAASAEDYEVLYREKSIVAAFKEAGFRTLVIANQKLTTSMIGSFYREADTFIDMSAYKTGNILSSLYDGELLPYLRKEIEKTEENLFVVLHTYGSHFNYHERYPQEFSRFSPDKAEGIRASYRKELRNAYDNSILYTDYVLGQVVEMLADTGTCSSMLYLSDHGEDIFDDMRHRYLHASPVPTYYQLHIPYLIWCSGAYRQTFPEKYKTMVAHASLPVSTNSVFHTMLDLAGIRSVVSDSTLALSHSAFRVRDRMYLGDHDDPIPFWEVGLRRQDFEKLDEWSIVYHKDDK